MMTLDEAIKHADDVAKDMELCCEECANDHRQLAKWLRELKSLKEKNNEILEYMKTCLSQSDELKEKHRNIDGDHHKRMAIIFEGMGEAYADLIDRFFKEETT